MKTIKSFGEFSVCQRSRQEGGTKYCVARGEKILEDFKRYAPAVKWAKRQRYNESVYQIVIPKMP